MLLDKGMKLLENSADESTAAVTVQNHQCSMLGMAEAGRRRILVLRGRAVGWSHMMANGLSQERTVALLAHQHHLRAGSLPPLLLI